MMFGKAVKSNVLQTSRFTHNLSNDIFIRNNIINREYLANQKVSYKFTTYIVRLSLYCVILDHPVTESIIVAALIFKFSFFLLIFMTQGPIRSIHILFCVISTSYLAGNLPCVYLTVLYFGKCHNYLLTSRRLF